MENEGMNELSVLVKNKKKLIGVVVVATVLLVAILAIFIKGYSSAKGKYEDEIAVLQEENNKLKNEAAKYATVTKEVSIDVINTKIQNIGELVTIEYLYTDAGKFEENAKLFDKEINWNLTKKTFLAKWDGVIKAGVDISRILVDVNKENKEIIISIPYAEITSHEIDRTSFEVLDEKAGLFNPIKVDDLNEFEFVTQGEMEERAIENGLLDKAFENAKTTIESLVESLVNSDEEMEQKYKITFKTIESEN